MNGWDRHQLIAGLLALATALFVGAGYVPLRHRQWLRRATVVFYLIAVAIVLAEIVRWLATARG